MSHIPSSAMPHPHAHDGTHEQPAPQSDAQPQGQQQGAEQPGGDEHPEQASAAPQPGEAAGTAFKAGAWLALGAGLTAALVAIVRRAPHEAETAPAKRRRKHKADGA